MHKSLTRTAAAILAAAAAPAALADVVFRPTPSMAIYAGGRISADQGVVVRGHLAAVAGVSMNQRADVEGDILSGADVWLGQDAAIDGRIVAGRDASFGQRASTNAIDAGRNVWIDQRSTVGRVTADGTFGASRDVSIRGGLRAAGSIWLDQNSTVEGNLFYGSSYSLASNARALGQIVNRIVEADEWSRDPLTMPAALPTGSQSLWMPQNTSHNLASGAYASLATGANASVTVGAGQHAFTTGWLDRGSVLTADTTHGDVYLVFSGAFSTGSQARIEKLGDGEVIIQAASIHLARSSIADAELIARSGNVSLEAGVQLTGRIIAASDVHLGSAAMLWHSAPAPGGAVLMALSALFASRRRRP